MAPIFNHNINPVGAWKFNGQKELNFASEAHATFHAKHITLTKLEIASRSMMEAILVLAEQISIFKLVLLLL
jgi:hypothetical protein